MKPRTIAIGDIHGCSAALDAVLEAIRPRPDDTIVTLGDYINRGPDSMGVIEGLIELAHRCRLVPLLGNHDQMFLVARSGLHRMTWIGMGGLATLDSYGPGRDLDCIPHEH
jgi:serine/threonine protein phosphatase 1